MRVRVFTAVAVCAALLASQAAAQNATSSTLADFAYTHEVLKKRTQDFGSPDSPFSQLSKTGRAWIAAETKRQVESPKSVTDLAASVEIALQDDELRFARTQHIDPLDITRVVTLLITADAEDAALKAAKKARKAGDPAALQAAADNAAQATARRKEAFAMQSEVSLALASM